MALETKRAHSEHVAWCRYEGNTIKLCDSDSQKAFRVYRKKHVGDCASDEASRMVCEGIYIDKVDDCLELVEALRAVRTMAGENPEVVKIIDKAIEEHGGIC